MTTSLVRQQYEELPYPPRNPDDEKQRLVPTVGDDLKELSHYCFKGRQTFRGHFRCLVAGGGTGDAAIFLAEQLRSSDAEIVYLDLSEASRRIAQQRARIRGLDNIRWVTASLLDIPRLGLGTFDYINCSGVLHHLSDPKEGLGSLAGALREGGAMFLMLYGRYGRRGVYEMQEILRTLLPDTLTTGQKIREARTLLSGLPATNDFQRNRDRWEPEIAVRGYGDAGLYDLLLHSRDVSYDVDGVYELLEAAGLELVGFTGPQKRHYDLKSLVTDPSTLRLCDGLSMREKYSVAEKLSGAISKHSFYAATDGDRSARLDDYPAIRDLCIVLAGEMKSMHEQIHRAIVPGETLCITHTVGNRQEVFRLPGNSINKTLFKFFDGDTPIETMIVKAKPRSGSGDARAVRAELQKAFDLLHGMGWAYLCTGQRAMRGCLTPPAQSDAGSRAVNP